MDVMTFIKPVLKVRFRPSIMWIENRVLDHLGDKYYKGDRTVWEAHRRHGYKMWRMGKSLEDIAFYHELPIRIVIWWAEIWDRYTRAWNFIEK